MGRTAFSTLMIVAWLVANAQAAETASSEHGMALAKTNCASCHAIDLEDESANSAAPPFRTLGERFPVETIDEALLAKVRPEHSGMPGFTLSVRQARDLQAHIAWLQPIVHGKRLVVENCARCHATGSSGKSTHPDAPLFRQLSKLYPIDALEEAFVEGIETGHPDMPSFTATPIQISHILDYISSIQE